MLLQQNFNISQIQVIKDKFVFRNLSFMNANIYPNINNNFFSKIKCIRMFSN